MDTNMLYSDDTYLFNATGTITDIVSVGGICEVFLDQTIFYPQGGGQPSDAGIIAINGEEYSVTAVEYRDGKVVHVIPNIEAKQSYVGVEVSMRIDENLRIRNSSLHTGGHLITHIFETIMPSMLPINGHHFPDGSYVEMLDKERIGNSEMLDEANEKLAQAINQDLSIESTASDFDEIMSLRPYLAVNVPKDKPTRIVKIGDFVAVPCGGTHVKSTGEVSGLKITRIKRKKERLRLSYELT